ncbi:hypothetical protein GJ744_007445 [Endocarpon pusillum]|uniref:Transcription initiation factor IIA large subunit n=1 Tax=Endocarpon pusillum TaxID=364733 RepID=A0A8H7ARD4_9EURO|nr:hypothetical protein GJ744_007445 [Endocarpon pusillum]
MSQQQVGQVYSKIIDEVCDASQIDFEEGGVDSETLKLLKHRWQKKLSALEVGHFPWEPQPQNASTNAGSSAAAASSTPQSTPNISSNTTKVQQLASENARPSPMPPSNQGPRVKAEPGQYQSTSSPLMGYPVSQMPQLHPGQLSTVAAERAAQALHQRFGRQAESQVNQLQQSISQRQQPGLPNSQGQDGDDRKPGLPSFSTPTPQSRTPLQSAQNDGSNDSLAEWKAEVARRRTLMEAPARGERLFYEHMLQRQQQIEGGGLMIPLNERHMPSAGIKRRVEALLGTDEEQYPQRAAPQLSTSLPKAQGDAAGDHDDDERELDEDAINSDLDDPEDAGGDPEDETVEQVMLCTYDKVQRVKNKWKCTLKDGILRVSNKEYVFHKGQGEFEW